ncbi:mechanosensitive ion channel family protein [bacterium]|nr:mechanosensitive ion channel family protein [bacterium]
MLNFWDKVLVWSFTSGLRILVIIIITLILMKVISFIKKRVTRILSEKISKDEEGNKRIATLSKVIRSALVMILWLIAGMMILGEFGIELGPLLAAAGVVGLAIGFGAQSLVKDILGGFFILLEDQIRVGDVVNIAGKSGLVESVNIRRTVLRDLEGHVHVIPHGEVGVSTNLTKGFSYYIFNIGVAYREDVDEVMAVMKEIGEALQQDENFREYILEPLEVLGLDKFADSAIIIKARYKTQPLKQWIVGREYNRLLKKAFDQKGIEIPFPHITLYPGQEKDGSAPALNLELINNRSPERKEDA